MTEKETDIEVRIPQTGQEIDLHSLLTDPTLERHINKPLFDVPVELGALVTVTGIVYVL
jgi:hypothetical protein